jgi:ubiquinone/menaquinone biosynthesis C-methylase UbiE
MRVLDNTVNWTSYSAVYDLMASVNPAYQELIAMADETLSQWELPVGARVVDIGAGTGNFSLAAARRLPHVRVIHLDNDSGMIAVAKSKAAAVGLTNIDFVDTSAEGLNYPPASIDAAISVHALYAIPRPQELLLNLRTWLKPGAPGLFCDLGRPMRVYDWAQYLFRSMRRSIGLKQTVEVFVKGRNIARQNKRIGRMQAQGTYWTHTPDEFRAAIRSAGFDITSQHTCYRGYSDFVVCRAE